MYVMLHRVRQSNLRICDLSSIPILYLHDNVFESISLKNHTGGRTLFYTCMKRVSSQERSTTSLDNGSKV